MAALRLAQQRLVRALHGMNPPGPYLAQQLGRQESGSTLMIGPEELQLLAEVLETTEADARRGRRARRQGFY